LSVLMLLWVVQSGSLRLFNVVITAVLHLHVPV
jgi:hypothetical protein